MQRKWSRGGKALFWTATGFAVVALWFQWLARDHIFRGDVWEKKYNFLRVRENGGPATCGSQLEQIVLAFVQYSQDNDERFPMVATTGATYGWANALIPYTKSTQILHCPRARSGPSGLPSASNYTDYWMNSRLNGKQLNWAGNAPLLAGEGNDGLDLTNARYAKSQIPARWKNNPQSPAFRHLSEEVWAKKGAFYVFADGHVKLLTPEETSNFFVPK